MPLTKNEIIEKVLKISDFPELNPMQKEVLKKGLLDGKNLVVAAPTASGKTLLCELAGINTHLNERRKMIYLGPLVALVSEKYNSFKKKYSSSIRVAMSVGDYDSSDHWLADYDWILMSNEKCDSLIRHGASWIKDVGLILVDEIHMLHDPSRGPTLEVTLTRLRELLPHAQILALSATINNAEELAHWLNAEVIVSEYRPVELHEGVYHDSKIKFLEKDNYDLNEDFEAEQAIFDNTVNMKKQALFFVATRRSTESLAEKLGKFNRKNLGKNEKEYLEKLSYEIENVLEVPTRQCKKISACVKNGVAFHHAGLLYKQKQMIEQNFKNGSIKSIAATPTLAYGVNLPAFRVIVRDVKRYYAGYGSRFIPVLEYKQFCGRAGRPQYDKWGESILVAKSEDEAQGLMDN
ncbi:DEAD/DEAH box helicase, partial [Candidatus Woesearchaeota archaeon]|nr:DEAD/DEAH box helicase [Candidatus Woesearchaeota archaeon]